jgi:hypothetical protein
MGSSSRHAWRLLIFVWVALLVGVLGAKADPVKTLVQDTLYRADGSVGHGTIAIHWSGFSTGAGESVAAGEMTFSTDANGGIAIPLIANTGSTPAGSYYKVVIKMDDGTTSEEQWVVPAVATTTVAAIRAKVVPQAVAAQFVSRDYVDSLLSAQSLDPPVHQSGAETIQGTKTFLSSPEVPAPSDAGGAANKGYVDQVAGHGNVNFASPGPIGVTAPAAINATAITAQKSITSLSPTADIRAYGAACDGVTDDRAAFQLAVNSVGASGGSILIPGLGAGCYIANPTLLTWPSFTGSLAINVQGKIIFGSTFTAPDWVDFVGQGGAQGTQFHSAGPTAWIQGPSTIGTLGTNVSTGMQTFTPSTMTGIYPGAAITVVGQAACAITSVSRTSNVVTATMRGACHVAPGYYAMVAGVSDNSYNGTFIISNSDYVLNTLSWQQTAGNSTSSGGTLAGVNEDSIETAIVTATTASTATASFVNAHSAADQWGIVGVYVSGLGHHSLRDVTVSASGTAIWLYEAANVHLTGVSAGSSLGVTNQALEINESWWIYIRDSVFQNFTGTSSWGIRFTNTHTVSSGDVAGLTYITDSNISGGIKLDRGTNYGQGNIYLSNTIVEQPTRGAFAVDTSMGAQALLTLTVDKVLLQDNMHGYSPCYFNYLYPNSTGTAVVGNVANSNCIANSYYKGALTLNGIQGNPTMGGDGQHAVNASNGRQTEMELRGSGANLSPSVIPYQTLNVPDLTVFSSFTGCTVTQGVAGPDGGTTATNFTATGSGTTAAFYNGYYVTPQVGDKILYGGWVQPPAGGIATGYNNASIGIGGGGSSTFTLDQGAFAGTVQDFEMDIVNDWFHPVVGLTTVTAVNGSGAQKFQLQLGCPAGGINYWDPWMIYIPASAEIRNVEIQRWRQQLLHGYVPSGAPAGTLATTPALKLSVAPVQSLTTTGTSGAATLSSGGVLNIPQYSGGANFPYPSSGIPQSTGSAWGTSYPVSGTGSSLMSNNGALTTAGSAANPAINIGAAGVGMFYISGQLGFSQGGANIARFSNSFEVGSGIPLAWSNASAPIAGSPDVSLCRSSAGVIGVWNGGCSGITGAFAIGTNIVLPSTLTGYHGNAAGVKVPLATNWTNTAGAPVCDDGNGNLTITGCSGGGSVSSVFGRTGAVTAQTGDYTAAQVGADVSGTASTVQTNLTAEVTRAEAAEGLLVAKGTTINGHALSSNVTVTASDVGAVGSTNPTLAGVTVGTSPLIVTTAGALSTPAVQISGAPVTGGSGTTTAPLVSIGGGAAGSYNTNGTMLDVNAPSGFVGNLLCLQVNGGSCVTSINSYGALSTSFPIAANYASTAAVTVQGGGINARSFGGYGSATLATGAAAGTSPTVACATNHVCSAVNGTINLTTGTSPTTGALLTISSAGLTHTNLPDCQAQVALTASPYTNPLGSTNPMFTYSTTLWTLNVGTALVASTAYTVTYSCPGY